jgi:type II secretion system protein C
MASCLALLLLLSSPADLKLIGVVTAQDPALSVAVLQQADGRTRAAAIGEIAFGARVVALGEGSVTIEVGGQSRVLRLAGGTVAAPASEAPPPSAAPAAAAPAPVNLPKQELDRRLAADMSRILAETTLVPVSEDGKIVGFRLARVPDGTLLTEVGLRAGDVLTEINGTPIDGLPTLLGLWTRLQGESHVNAVVLRDGKPVPLVLNLN